MNKAKKRRKRRRERDQRWRDRSEESGYYVMTSERRCGLVSPVSLSGLSLSGMVTAYWNGHLVVSKKLVKKLWDERMDEHLDDMSKTIKKAEERMKKNGQGLLEE